ncbi:hypothetical protein R3W88_026846 [Solanum pinnatisectum]|uniref:Integrase core domain containing protein n=1 Tax=Solanum pinnatisectum TaxID=50273 RepID=A0AAV9LFJ4_9SOLN|nr:hypothetical protein R3W88_026846 [Solanum pinnatisectum]
MATLLQHVKPWMQRSIGDSEARMETMMDWKVQAIHKRLDAFKLRVLARPAPTTDLSSIRTELDNLQANIDAILAPHADEPESTPIALADDTGKEEGALAHEQVRKASIVDEELHEQRVRESTLGALSSRPTIEATMQDDVGTTDGVVRVIDRTTKGDVIDDVGTTEGDPSVVPVGSGKRDPPAC